MNLVTYADLMPYFNSILLPRGFTYQWEPVVVIRAVIIIIIIN